ncbi:MAG: response regulator transcription factor [Erysipelotrichaceae bacterium]|nr:response regulator transcription factor [Erysipelotrichaceae bacterium]
MKLLLVEDTIQLNRALSTLLKRNSYLVDSAFDGEEALLFLKDYTYDVIVLDIMLPRIDGLEVLKRARSSGIQTPIILLTAKSTVEDKITGLDLGADDYLPKPFSTEELLARIRALTRRKNNVIKENKEITYGDLLIDENNLSIKVNDRKETLSKKEMQILMLLVENKEKVVSLDTITRSAWDVESYSTNENVWVFISYLRKKLESLNSKVKIKSIRYQGYYLEYKND